MPDSNQPSIDATSTHQLTAQPELTVQLCRQAAQADQRVAQGARALPAIATPAEAAA